MVMDWRDGRRIHPLYRAGLPVSVGLELAAFAITPTPVGHALAEALGWVGRVMAPFY